jgi:hypothetical protein
MALTVLPHASNSKAFTARLDAYEKPIPLFNISLELYFPGEFLQKHSNLSVNIDAAPLPESP